MCCLVTFRAPLGRYLTRWYFLALADEPHALVGCLERRWFGRRPFLDALRAARGLAHLMGDRLDGAVDMFEKCARRDPAFLPGRLYLASSYSLAGRDAEGREQIAELQRLSPNYRMARLGEERIRDPERAKRFTESLRRVGLL